MSTQTRPERRPEFEQRRIFGIFMCTDNTSYHAGNVRLFHDNGPLVYLYTREAGSREWAIRRTWIIFMFALTHIGEGKSTSIPGWHFVFPSVTMVKLGGTFTITFRKIDLYGSIRTSRLERFKHWIRGDRFYSR